MIDERLVKAEMKRLFKRLLAVLVLLAVVVVGALAWRGWRLYRTAFAQMPLQQLVQQRRAAADYTPLEQLPQMYLDAVVAVEDHRFYKHHGVDPIAIGRAIVVDLATLSFAEGGSTLTQQLAKNLYFTHAKTLDRKVAEVFAAWELEKALTKQEILELYANSVYFGSGCYSIGSASQRYFGCAPAALNDAQCVMLAGLPKAPSVYDPSDGEHRLALQRQKQVLRRMVDTGVLTGQQADEIAAQPVF